MSRDTLANPRKIAIIGGGPAGSLCALSLLRLSEGMGRELEVTIFDRKQFGVAGHRGCNMCAGIVSDSLVRHLEGIDVRIPPESIQRPIERYNFQVRGASVRLCKPEGSRIYASFRGGGPMGEHEPHGGFDQLLLESAIDAGAGHVRRVVSKVRLPESQREPVVLIDEGGDEHPCDALVGAFGVNSKATRGFQNLGFGYRPPPTANAAQCEIPLPPAELESVFGNEVKAMSLGMPGMGFAALVPKREHVTVSLVGRHVTPGTMERFLEQPEVREHFPDGPEPRNIACRCKPKLPIGCALSTVADRVVVVGDAHTSRYLKNGLDSAYVTASLAACSLMTVGAGRGDLQRTYVEACRRVFAWDNLYGRAMLRLFHLTAKLPRVAAAQVRLVADEVEAGVRGPMSRQLWGMLTGDEPYGAMVRRLIQPGVAGKLGWASLLAALRFGGHAGGDRLEP